MQLKNQKKFKKKSPPFGGARGGFYESNKLQITIFLLLILLSSSKTAFSQNLFFDVGLHPIADNREYFNKFQNHQTILGIRFLPSIKAKIDSFQEMKFGFNYLYEYGIQQNPKHLDLTLFYHFNKKNVELFAGLFPRRNLIDDFPLALLYDTINYYRPNVQGLFAKKSGNWGNQKIWIDWTSRQGDSIRETFLVGHSGKIQKSIFFLKHYFLMYHFAGPKIPIPDDHLRDNIGFLGSLGLDLSKKTKLKTLTFSIGLLVSFDRLRNVYDWKKARGLLGEIEAEYQKFSLKQVIYAGDSHDLLWGDNFYQANNYARTDLGFQLFNSKFVKGKFIYSLHFIENKLNHQQQLNLFIDLENFKLRKKN